MKWGGGRFKRVLSKEITGKAIDQGKILKWSMALGRPQIRIPKKSKDKYKEFSQLSLKLEKGAKEK